MIDWLRDKATKQNLTQTVGRVGINEKYYIFIYFSQRFNTNSIIIQWETIKDYNWLAQAKIL